MVTKKIILLLIVLSIITSGCLNSESKKDKEQKSGGSSGGTQKPREMRTPEGMRGEIGTPVETETQEETVTEEETERQVEPGASEKTVTSGMREEPGIGQTESGTAGGERDGTVQPAGTASTSHLVRLKNYVMIPSRLEVNTGDTVVWRNYQESSVLILTSREHLFGDERLVYGNTLEHTFNEPGSYNFSVKGYPKMQMTITVK